MSAATEYSCFFLTVQYITLIRETGHTASLVAPTGQALLAWWPFVTAPSLNFAFLIHLFLGPGLIKINNDSDNDAVNNIILTPKLNVLLLAIKPIWFQALGNSKFHRGHPE